MCRTKSVPGVYLLRNMATFDMYVGSTNNLSQRKRTHFYDLRHNRYTNPPMQESYNQYGEDVFDFLILEFVDNKSELINREQWWIDHIKPTFNINLIAGNVIPLSAKTSKANKKRSEAVKKLWKDPDYYKRCLPSNNWKDGIPNRKGAKLSEETKKKLSQASSGKNNSNYGKPKSESFMKKMCKTYDGAISPDGEIYSPIIGLNRFCREFGLDNGQMSRLFSRKINSHQGWTRV